MRHYSLSSCELYVMENLVEKCRGVIGRTDLLNKGAILIPSCNWVHSFFVEKPLHIFFLSDDYSKILHTERLSPNRISHPHPDAAHVLETLTTHSQESVDLVLSFLHSDNFQ